jgi:NAD(P)-dependent dehydrogenase (short-subunit alcohol dehydrogenase family)
LLSELKGKTALVTGASRGIGAATAVTLANNGCGRVIVHYNSYPEGAKAVVEQVRAAGAEAESVQADLGTPAGIRAFRSEITGRGIDILINNAGSLVKRSSLVDFSEDLFDQVMDLNFRSAWFLSQAVAPEMIRRGWGVIVNVSSIAARHGGGPGAAIYAASKAAVACVTKGMAKELAPKGVRVNAVSPGTVDNHFHEVFSTREILDSVVRMTPQGRLGTDQEIADTILFLCSNGSSHVHGQTIEINGGMFMV